MSLTEGLGGSCSEEQDWTWSVMVIENAKDTNRSASSFSRAPTLRFPIAERRNEGWRSQWRQTALIANLSS